MPGLDVVVLGGAAMDRVAEVCQLPAKDTVVLAWSDRSFPGGSAANVAVALARLGQRTGFVGKVGDDLDGVRLVDAFRDDGVDTSALIVEQRSITATCFIAVDPNGERSIVAFPGASLIESTNELDATYIGSARALYVGPAFPDVAQAAMNAIHNVKGTVFYAPSGAWGQDGLAGISQLVQQADVMLLSQTEAAALAGSSDPHESARLLQGLGPSVVIVTLGASGALVCQAGETHLIPAFRPEHVRDTTGAGDAFAAAVISHFVRTSEAPQATDWSAAVTLGCAAAALKIQHLGARNGLPTQSELANFLGDPSTCVKSLLE